jgi:hypothetical protein
VQREHHRDGEPSDPVEGWKVAMEARVGSQGKARTVACAERDVQGAAACRRL